MASGFDREVRTLPGSLAVCCYTWNKAADLSRTLDALLPVLAAAQAQGAPPLLVLRITSYNVCYTKLLRRTSVATSIYPATLHL